jgi:WD40 repeat protein
MSDTIPPTSNGGKTEADSAQTPPLASSYTVPLRVAEAQQAESIQVPGYEILGQIGRGGMGVVYRARHVGLDRVVALKVLLGGSHAGTAERDRFRREAQAIARLQHAHIVQVYDVGEHFGLAYLALEFVSGGSLSDRLDGRPWAPRAAAELVERLAGAVEAAHRRGIIHRDLKPANVLLGADGVPKVTDFGLAKHLDVETSLTPTGAVVGTPGYMAPEQAAGKTHEIGPGADVYGLGAILYELLTGRPPFRGKTPVETVLQVLHAEPMPPGRLRPDCPRDLETICLTCLNKEPQCRYLCAADLAEDLRRFVAGETIAARHATTAEQLWRWVKRRPAMAGLVAACAVAALSLVGALVAAVYNSRLGDANARLQEEQRRTAEALSQRELYLYFNRIALAEHEWQGNNVRRAEELLTDCPQRLRGWEWHYLDRLCHPALQTYLGHGHEVHDVAFSPDGRLAASCSIDRSVKVWDVATGRVLHDLHGHSPGSWVRRVAFGPKGDVLASAAYGLDRYEGGKPPSEVKLWDLHSGRERWTVPMTTGRFVGVAFCPDGREVAAACTDGTVVVWDVANGSRRKSFQGKGGEARALAYQPDGRCLAAVGAQGDHGWVAVWDAQSGERLHWWTEAAGELACLAYSPDGRRLGLGCDDETVRVWDARDGRTLGTLRGHTHFIRGVRWSPNCNRLVSCAEDGTVRVWDSEAARQLLIFRGHTGGGVNGVDFSPDGSRILSAGDDRTLRLWDATAAPEARILARGHTDAVRGLAFDPEGRRLVTAGLDGAVKLWDLSSGAEIRTLQDKGRAVHAVAFAGQNSSLVATGGGGGGPDRPANVTLWDWQSGRVAATLSGHKGAVTCLAVASGGLMLASGGTDNLVRLWRLPDGRQVGQLAGHHGPLAGLAFSQDGRQLASTSYDRSLKVWDISEGKYLASIPAPQDYYFYGVSWEPLGGRLAVACGDGTVRLVDAASGAEVGVLRRHAHNVVAVCFSPDGKRIASLSEDKTVKFWDAATGQELLTLQGAAGWESYNSLAFSPDGRRLAAPAPAGAVCVWDATPQVPGQDAGAE